MEQIPKPQKYVEEWPFGLLVVVLGNCFTYFWGPGFLSTLNPKPATRAPSCEAKEGSLLSGYGSGPSTTVNPLSMSGSAHKPQRLA